MQKMIIAVAVGVSAVIVAMSFAAKMVHKIKLTNDANWALCGAYIAPAREYPRHWGANLIGASCLEPGESRQITLKLDGEKCVVDWMFRLKDYPDGDVERLTFNVCVEDEYVLGD